MKEKVKNFILANIPCMFTIGCGTILACLHIEGWGWVIFVGALFHVFIGEDEQP